MKIHGWLQLINVTLCYNFVPKMIQIPTNSHFTIHNIPFGICSDIFNSIPRPCSAIGEYAIDLNSCASLGIFDESIMKQHARKVFLSSTLNEFMALGRPYWKCVRSILQELLSKDDELIQKSLIPLKNVTMHLPVQIGDYTDFYASKEHATNVGTMFRGKENALQPNW